MLEALGQSVVISVLGGVLSLDRTGAFQLMVSRPVVAAPVTGFVLGMPFEGLVTGVLLEFLLIGDLPVGAYVPIHETGLSVLTTGMVAAASAATGAEGLAGVLPLLPGVLIAAVPASMVYKAADAYARRFNARFYYKAVGSLERGEEVSLARENLKGLSVFFLLGTVSLLATVFPGMLASRAFFSALGADFFEPAVMGVLVLGAAASYSILYTGRSIYIFSGSLVLGAVLLSLW